VTRVYHTAGEGETAALAGVDLDILDNEFFTLLGPSGCGKTTLLRMVAGFDEPTEGHVLLFGQPIQGLPPHRRPVNTVFQSYALFPHMSVAGNVGFALEMLGWPRAEREARVAEMLDLVRLPELGRRKPGQLSGGQQQRVALARALAPRPKVLLLDEPLSALDLKLRKEMQIELKRLQRETGITFVFVTHDQEEALTMSDRIAVMRSGHVLQVGSPRDVYEHPRHRFVAQFIGETNLVGGRVVGEADGAALVDLDGGMRVALRADGVGAGRPVTLAVRPERLRLAAGGGDGDGGWPGTVGEAVYSGTDTAYHVALDGGPTFVVREQNRAAGTATAAVGERVSVVVEPDAWQVLED
jgi:spermidine/putrescine transport system ATP-binding protein